MRKRRSFNPKRRLSPRYNGNPEHKRNPGNFGLDPPSSPRPGKTLCDAVHVYTQAQALEMLSKGFSRGLFSAQERDGWPQNVWAVTDDGNPLEAQHERDGLYHGYPMPAADPFRDEVLARWEPK